MSKQKILLITGFFLVILTGFRLLWVTLNMTLDHPKAVQGVLDLRNWDIENNRTITLDGSWEFYPNQFIAPAAAGDRNAHFQKTYVHVPGDWSSSLSASGDSAYGYGSYRLRILTGGNEGGPYGILVRSIQASSELYVNGKLMASFGRPAEQAEQYVPRNTSYSVSFATDQSEIEIIMHAANFDHPLNGGIAASMKFGSQAAADTERLYSVGFQLVTCVVLLLHGLYAGVVYFINRRQKILIYFFLLVVCAALSVVIDDDKILLIWLPINYVWSIKLIFISYLGTGFFMLKLTKCLFPEYERSRTFRWYFILSGIYSLYVLLLPVKYVLFSKAVFSFFVFFPTIAIVYMIIRMIRKRYNDAIFLLLSAVSITSSLIWGMIKGRGWIENMGFYPLDIIAAIIGFASYWFKRYFLNAEQTAKLAEQLQREDKLKDDFLANTSHELRTPLHGMINIAQNVVHSSRNSLNEENRKDLELLITVGRRMSYLLGDLLDLTQLKENKIKLQRSDLQIQSVASGVLDMLRFMTEGKPLLLTMDIPKSFPPVVADEKRIVQVLFNLLHNAIKFTNEGMIAIHAETRDGTAYIHVSDSGIGMDKETQLRIFQAYEQGDSGISAGGGGIGLGLSICKQLVELHGGSLWVKSAPGKGSVFTFTLPLSKTSVRREDELQSELAISEISVADHSTMSDQLLSMPELKPAPAAGKAKILAVDDDPVNLKILCNILSADQYNIVTAMSGKEALARIDAERWDLVIADVMMPQMSGYQFAGVIRERFSISELPILLLTARSRPEDVYSGFLSGANDYVTKPVDALELQYRVRALTDVKQSIGERLRMEAAYLQAQIQPHFLFNTLNSITALSDIDTIKMHNLIEAFSTYLRISFDFWNSEQIVPLDYELELVRSYLYIEKERFGERLNISWEVDADIQLLLPPLTIQPLVENAVRHGILSRSQGGTVHIQITDHTDNTEISIADNGVGMDEAKVRYLFDSTSNIRRGIGLLNTDRRLKQMYGNGLTIESTPDQGTTISFVIPKKGMV